MKSINMKSLIIGLVLCGCVTGTWTGADANIDSTEPITFSNINSRMKDIPIIVWKNSQSVLMSNRELSNSSVALKILVGPNTNLFFKDNEQAFSDAITFWANFKQPTRYVTLFYNFEDKSWAVSEYKKLSFYREGMETMIDAPCTPTKCTGANTGIQSFSSIAVGVFGIDPKDARGKYRYGPMQIHEYTHAVQAAPWIGDYDPNQGHVRISPCWLHEGTAHFAGLTVGTDSYEDYQKIRAQQVWGDLFSPSPRVPSFDDFSPIKIVDYYDKSVPGECYPPHDPHGHYDLGYSLGFLTVEALSAIGGSDSSMNLYKLMTSNTFREAFELTYGSPWDEAKHIIASVVSSNIFDIENNISKFR